MSATDATAQVIPTVAVTRYVAPLREGGSLPGIVEAFDAITRARRCRIAVGGADHRQQGVGSEDGRCGELTVGGLAQQLQQAGLQARQHHLRLGVAEADVVLEHLGSLRSEHQAGVEHPSVVDPAPA